jgi:hypothetical protein
MILILAQASPASNDFPYMKFARRADLIVIAWANEINLDAKGEKTNWTVTYRVNKVLKGNYNKKTLTLRFDSNSFKHEDFACKGTNEKHNMRILFVHSGGGRTEYVGPPINSSRIRASEANLAALRTTLAKPEARETTITWYEVSPAGVILVAAFLVVLLVLVVVIRKRPRPSTDSNNMP